MNLSLVGVFPVLPTPFRDDGAPDVVGLRTLVHYLLRCGVDGMTFPGVASEVSTLNEAERLQLAALVLHTVAGRVPVVIGVSSADTGTTEQLARAAAGLGAAALMVAAPPDVADVAGQIERLRTLTEAVPGIPLMLQNVPPPVGAGLAPAALLEILRAVPAVRYVKEEALPSGQRLSEVLAQAPPTLAGVLGGAGGRYITDELRRGACGTMPAIELAEVHVALYAAHRDGDAAAVRKLFTRMLPILNIQAVFRWSLTKHVLQRRGLIASTRQRIAGPRLDALDAQDVDAFLDDLRDLLLPPAAITRVVAEGAEEGAADRHA
ncbi:MAG: dihydrodipicolinate synthase family protein [Burkholderiaceae bacterium]